MRAAASLAIACLLPALAGAQVNLFEDDDARMRLAELEQRMETLQGGLRRLAQESAALTADKQELLAQFRQLSGLIEEANITSSRHAELIGELDAELSGEVTNAEQRLTAAVDKLANNLVTDPGKSYARALQAREAGQLGSAEKRLRALLRRFPASSYAAPARYWLAQLAHEQGQADNARDELLAMLSLHPDNPRLPDALALLALLAYERGALAEAEHWRARLLDRHATSAAADRARLGLLLAPDG